MYISVRKLTIIGSDNGLAPTRRQAIIWTNAGLLSFARLGTIFSEICNQNKKIFIHKNPSENIVCEMSTTLSWRRWVTTYVLNCFEKMWIYICFLCNSSTTKYHRQSKSFFMKYRDLPILHIISHCHRCWWPGDARSKGISRNDIDLVCLEYNIFKCFYLNKHYCLWFKFHQSQHCFRLWLGAELATSHYLNQRWPSPLMHISMG